MKTQEYEAVSKVFTASYAVTVKGDRNRDLGSPHRCFVSLAKKAKFVFISQVVSSCRCRGGLSIHGSVQTTQLRWLVTSQIFLMYDNMTKEDFQNVAITSDSYSALVV